MESKENSYKEVILTIVIVSLTLLYSFSSHSDSKNSQDKNISASSEQVETAKGISSIN